MELILWRHTEAEPGEPDSERALTAKGQKQAAKMGQWLDRHLPQNCKILCSPAKRTLQTVEALGRKFKTHPALFTDATPESILAAVNWPDSREPVLVVGHQPTLGQVASLAISGTVQDWTIKKGHILWIAHGNKETPPVYIRAALGPEFVAK
jgi:phosphohistidine phosphatase